MATTVYSSDKARTRWRHVIDAAVAGENVIIERYGKPAAAVIPYQDFLELEEMLEDLHDIREAQIALDEWRRDPSTARPWEDIKADLIADGLLDE
ncbi:MAG TPA: type II toxin-antitoxin system prevent-host-death family antitoxin [Anaerolineae bacterium]|nr:type II toxin-antitoxin system prevent-host-death family antitoxin [Anaerolineae bacterium]